MPGVALRVFFGEQAPLLDFIAGVLPAFDAADHGLGIGVAHKGQIARGQGRAVASGAIEHDFRVAIYSHVFFDVELQKTAWDQLSPGDIAVHDFFPLAHIYDVNRPAGLEGCLDFSRSYFGDFGFYAL